MRGGEAELLGEGDDEFDRVRESLRRELAEWERQTPARPPIRRSSDDVDKLGDGRIVPSVDAADPEGPGPELEEQLRALGYLGSDE
ncbi:MAG: hypothetical protein JRH10_22405 [Deltaproteobacteria bacterium]|nr:hypothetical protein [Deltaproteobacteria bacterium]